MSAEEMDKKSGRQNFVPPKTGSECKKDVCSQKGKYTGRRREGGAHYDQLPPSCYPPPQRSKNGGDRRPRARGVHHGDNPQQMTTVDGTELEYGSAQAWGSKKGNASHLLNFHFEPREGYSRGSSNTPRPAYRGRARQPRSHAKRYNKEHFLQANCQFVVKETGDYSKHTVDPDTLVDWDLIELVRTYSHSTPSCPICLFSPTAAKITRCGHIYCTACILHYLSLGEKKWRRCPICYDSVQQTDLKSVVCVEIPVYKVGQEITMKLMKRKRGDVQALPIDVWQESDGKLSNMTGGCVTRYMKLVSATPDQVQDLITTERCSLNSQLQDEYTDSLESSYIEAALELVNQRQADIAICQSVSDQIHSTTAEGTQVAPHDGEPLSPSYKPPTNQVVYSSAFSDDEEDLPHSTTSDPPAETSLPADAGEHVLSDLTPDTGEHEISDRGCKEAVQESDRIVRDCELVAKDYDLAIKDSDLVAMGDEDVASAAKDTVNLGGVGSFHGDHYYYFYQSVDGQHIYPHSINARCLVREYGSLESSPPTITARIVELEDCTMTEELRQRIRYMSHLPVTCEFQIAELALKPPLVSRDTVKLFSVEFDRKKKQRQRKSREERKLSRRIQEQENKEMGIDPSVLIVKSEMPDSYIVRSASAPVIEVPNSTTEVSTSPTGSISPEILATSPATATSSDDGGQTTALSFAQMLRAGKAKPQDTSWGKSAAAGASDDTSRPRKTSGSESDNEDRVPVPGYKASFGDAIQQALDKYKHTGDVSEVAPPAIGVGKKKKKQKTLLFATSMNRAK